jgi:hypothetical protein
VRSAARSYVNMALPPKAAKSHVRFTPESRHVRCTRGCPLRAKSGHAGRKGALKVDDFDKGDLTDWEQHPIAVALRRQPGIGRLF